MSRDRDANDFKAPTLTLPHITTQQPEHCITFNVRTRKDFELPIVYERKTKKCIQCEELKSTTCFYMAQHQRNGKFYENGKCRKCVSEYARKRYGRIKQDRRDKIVATRALLALSSSVLNVRPDCKAGTLPHITTQLQDPCSISFKQPVIYERKIKICKGCEELKSTTWFYTRKAANGKFCENGKCKNCVIEYAQKRQARVKHERRHEWHGINVRGDATATVLMAVDDHFDPIKALGPSTAVLV